MVPVIVMLSSTAKLVDTTISIGSLPFEPIGWLPIGPIDTIVAVPRPPVIPLGSLQLCICSVHSPVEALSSLLHSPMAPVHTQTSLVGDLKKRCAPECLHPALEEQGVVSCQQAVLVRLHGSSDTYITYIPSASMQPVRLQNGLRW